MAGGRHQLSFRLLAAAALSQCKLFPFSDVVYQQDSYNHALPLPGKDDEKYIQPMADIFKVLSDPTRIRILSLLAHEEMCVTCIADALGMTHSAISHQLRLLRATNLVKFTKDGKEVIYSLDDSHVLSLFDQALDHVKHKVL